MSVYLCRSVSFGFIFFLSFFKNSELCFVFPFCFLRRKKEWGVELEELKGEEDLEGVGKRETMTKYIV